MKNISGRHPLLLQAWKRAGASKISLVFFFFFFLQSHQLVYYKALPFSTHFWAKNFLKWHVKFHFTFWSQEQASKLNNNHTLSSGSHACTPLCCTVSHWDALCFTWKDGSHILCGQKFYDHTSNYLRKADLKKDITIAGTYYTWCPTSSRPGPYLECRISGLVTVLSTSNTTVHCGYCLKQRIPALLMTKRSMKLNLQLFPLSSKFNQSKFFGKKVNKKTQEIKHKSGNLPRGEEQKGRELAGFITKYTLC